MKNYIFIRALKHVEHTVFCVQNGQKIYYDNQFNCPVAFSSGQQVKRSILDALTSSLNVQMAPITFNYNINDKKHLENKELWSPCDPTYIDQLIGGWMMAKDGKTTKQKKQLLNNEEEEDKTEIDKLVIKRRSPLSISAMRPLHPLLAGVDKENITFDRSDNPDRNPVIVRMAGRDNPLSEEEIQDFLDTNNRSLTRRNWIPKNTRTSGLFIYEIAIDLRTLFSVSLNQHEPELSKPIIEKLRENGWVESENIFGKCLVLPKKQRDRTIPALAHALLNWRITSNQARTFSLMETLAVAISDNANTVAGAIRAKLIEDTEKPKAKPILDETTGAKVFVTLPCAGYIITVNETVDALERAEQELIDLMMAFDYENQL